MNLRWKAEIERARALSGAVKLEQTGRSKRSLDHRVTSFLETRLLREAGIFPKQVVTWFLPFVVLAALFIVILHSSLPALLLPVAVVALYINVLRCRDNRTQLFERDYPALLLSLSSSVRTGLDPLIALKQASDLFAANSLVRSEIKMMALRLDEGAAEDEAVRTFAQHIAHPDISLFRTALLLSRQEGSSLAACLHRLARVTRARQSFRRRVRAALAMQKLSAIGIACCAVGVTLFQGITNPKSFVLAFHDPLGSKVLMVGISLMLLGLIGMYRLGGPEK